MRERLARWDIGLFLLCTVVFGMVYTKCDILDTDTADTHSCGTTHAIFFLVGLSVSWNVIGASMCAVHVDCVSGVCVCGDTACCGF